MHLVIGQLLPPEGAVNLAPLRQVCKAWRDALAGYPLEPSWEYVLDGKQELSKLIEIMPGIASLQFSALKQDLDLQPLSACTQLTTLWIDHNSDNKKLNKAGPLLSVDVSSLPASLEDFQLDGVRAQLTQSGSLVNLSKLTCLMWQPQTLSRLYLICDILPLLPELKVWIAPASFHFPLEVVRRMNRLTRSI